VRCEFELKCRKKSFLLALIVGTFLVCCVSAVKKQSPFEICQSRLGHGFKKPEYVCANEEKFIFCVPEEGKVKEISCPKGTECSCGDKVCGPAGPCTTKEIETKAGAHCEKTLGKHFKDVAFICTSESHYIQCVPGEEGKDKEMPCPKGTHCDCGRYNSCPKDPCKANKQ